MASLICTAPSCESVRVSTHHCEIHHKQLNKIYMRYKKLQSQLPIVDNEKLTPKLAFILYTKYKRVYDLRTKYTSLGFSEEYRDEGHKYMIDNLFSIMQCLIMYIEENTKDIKEIKEKGVPELVSIEEIDDNDEAEYKEIEEKDVDEVSIRKLKVQHKEVENRELWERRIPCMIIHREQEDVKRDKIIEILGNKIEGLIRQFSVTKRTFDEEALRRSTSTLLAFVYQLFFCLLFTNITSLNMHNIKVVHKYLKTLPLCCLKVLCSAILRMEHKMLDWLFFFVVGSPIAFKEAKYVFVREKDYYKIRFYYGRVMKDKDSVIDTLVVPTDQTKCTNHEEFYQCKYCIEELRKDLKYGTLHV